jgi:Fe-S cluster assembly protein SufD
LNIVIPKNTISEPITLDSSSDVSITVEEGAQVYILNSVNQNQSFKILVNDNAQAHVSTMFFGSTESVRNGSVNNNGKLTWVDVIVGNDSINVNTTTNLIKSGAETYNLQAFMGTGQQKVNINSDVIHNHSNTSSMMQAKGIVSGKSKAQFQGTIKVEQNAANCNAHQKSDILLLGENAKCDSTPILDINNDDVVCSHGATIGQIDEEQLFYLQARGLNNEVATQMIVQGFLEPILKEIQHNETKEKINEMLKEKWKACNKLI